MTIEPHATRLAGGSDGGCAGDATLTPCVSLSAIGLGRGDRMVIMMRNVPEFHLIDTAAMLLGATAISIYNSSAPEQIQYLVDHSEAKVAVLEDVEFLERVRKVRAQLPGLESVVLLHGADELAPDGVVPFAQAEQSGAVDLDQAAAVAQPEDLATVIYTSGTTGPPKGVMLSHLREVRPEVFLAVPRVWEKLHAGIQAALAGDAEKKAGFEVEHLGRRRCRPRDGDAHLVEAHELAHLAEGRGIDLVPSLGELAAPSVCRCRRSTGCRSARAR